MNLVYKLLFVTFFGLLVTAEAWELPEKDQAVRIYKGNLCNPRASDMENMCEILHNLD